MDITDEMVERGARAACEADNRYVYTRIPDETWFDDDDTFDEFPHPGKNHYRSLTRAALTAALGDVEPLEDARAQRLIDAAIEWRDAEADESGTLKAELRLLESIRNLYDAIDAYPDLPAHDDPTLAEPDLGELLEDVGVWRCTVINDNYMSIQSPGGATHVLSPWTALLDAKSGITAYARGETIDAAILDAVANAKGTA